MTSLAILQQDNHHLPPKEKGKEIVLESVLNNSAQRKKLADISNLQKDQMKSEETIQQQQNALFSSKEYVEKLQKENMTLMKALANRNKIIELSGIEFQKLRIHLRTVQEKNLQFAQANSQMLAELNTNRDRLKVLQHELSCKNALLNAKKMQVEEPMLPLVTSQEPDMNQKDTKKKRTSRITRSSDVKPTQDNEKANNSKRRVSGVVDATGICEETCQTEEDFEKGIESLEANQTLDNFVNKKFVLDAAKPVKDSMQSKRQCARRQSTRFHAQEIEQPENLLETDDAKDTKETTNAKDTKETARLPTKRRSARLRPEDAEPCKTLHDKEEVREPIKKRRVSARQQSTRFDVQEPEVTETVNADDTECVVIEESVETISIAVEEPSESKQETKETNGKRRVSARRQSAKSKSQTAAETNEAIKEVATSLHNSIVQECDPVPSSEDGGKKSKNKPKADETEEMTKRTSVGRPSRHAAEKVQSYREISLKAKMRRH